MNLKLIGLLLAGAALVGAIGFAIKTVVSHFDGDKAVESELIELRGETEAVVQATRDATCDIEPTKEGAVCNEDLTWETVPGQIVALGVGSRDLRVSLDEQTEAVNKLAQEAVRLRAEASELRKIADRAKAQRQAALDRLSDLAITPGTRTDCLTLLSEAEEALDLLRASGI